VRPATQRHGPQTQEAGACRRFHLLNFISSGSYICSMCRWGIGELEPASHPIRRHPPGLRCSLLVGTVIVSDVHSDLVGFVDGCSGISLGLPSAVCRHLMAAVAAQPTWMLTASAQICFVKFICTHVALLGWARVCGCNFMPSIGTLQSLRCLSC
jgi:hypothetical protein